jgi:class 3 adenylate cyclase
VSDAHIHDYLGDGMTVYSGFPAAHEDDAQRAVRSGLAIVDALSRLSSKIQPECGVELHVRVAIDAGLVVAGQTRADPPGEAITSEPAVDS